MGRRVPLGYQQSYGDNGAGTGGVLLLYNRGYGNSEYCAGAVGVVVVVGNFCSWDSSCYSLVCSSVAYLGAGGVLVASCFIEFSTKLVRGDVPLLFVVAKIGAWCCFLRRMVVRYGAPCPNDGSDGGMFLSRNIKTHTHDYTE